MERVLLAEGSARDVSARAVPQLRRDGSVTARPDGGIQVAGPTRALGFGDLGEAVRACLDALAAGAHSHEELNALALDLGGPAALLRLQKVIERLDREALLEHSLLVDGETFVRLRPIGRRAVEWAPVSPHLPLRLSRFATISAQGGQLVARGPDNPLALELYAPAVPLLAALAQPRTPADLARVTGLPAAVAEAALRHLQAAGLLCITAGTDPETGERERAQWSPVDRWLHATSRGPKLASGYGGTYRFADRFSPLPAAAPPAGTDTVDLVVPDLAAVAAADPPLTAVVEARRSIREHDAAAPIGLEQLGELLYRAARQSTTFTASHGQEHAIRPYPSGGGAHELEIYPLVTGCRGLPAGLWHYRAGEHRLELVSEPSAATAALVAGARDGAVMDADPQITLLITARFGRVMWKYESMGYALILKHVGVLYQTIYLVATAMNLAVCGLGGGDSDEFAAASGVDSFTESTVGEMVLGSRPTVLRHPYRLPVDAAAAHGSAPDRAGTA